MADSVSRRQLTVLFCDIVDSTAWSAHDDPEEWFDALSAYRAMVRDVALRWGGVVARMEGDGLDLYFGHPTAREDDAARAIHAGLAITGALAAMFSRGDLRLPLQCRIGIATGRVAVASRAPLSVAGTTPNLAARIQAAMAPGDVGVSPRTRRIAGAPFTYRELGLVPLKGFDEPIRLAAATGALSTDARSAWRGHAARDPLFGRQQELYTLFRWWHNARADQGATAWVVGDPGIGKSRLVAAFESVLSRAVRTLRLQCAPLRVNTALGPFVRHFDDVTAGEPPDDRLARLAARLARAGVTAEEDVATIGQLIGLGGSEGAAPVEHTRDVLTRYCTGLAGDEGLLLVVEDLHWIDPTSLALLQRLVQHPAAGHTRLLLTSRADNAPAWDNTTLPVETVRLGPLPHEAVRDMVLHLVGDTALDAAALGTIIRKTDGVPLYVEEMTHMALERRPFAGRAPARVEDQVPDTLADLLMERLDRLGAAKWFVQVAAVIGREFSRTLLLEVSGVDAAECDGALSTMTGSGLILNPGGDHFAFKHALVEEVAYESMLTKVRARLHGRMADLLLRDPAWLEHEPERAARHLSLAQRPLEAATCRLQAARQALGRGAPREAAAHLQDGVAALVSLPPSPERDACELALLSVLGPTTMVLHGPGSARFGDIQKRAHALCQRVPGRPGRFAITYGLCLFHWGSAQLDTAQVLARSLLDDAAAQPGDDERAMAAHTLSGIVKFHRGDAPGARLHLAESVRLYQPDVHAARLYPVYLMDFGVFGRFYLALATWVTGDAAAAQRHVDDARALAATLNQPHTTGFALLATFTIAVLRGEPHQALDAAEECIAFSSKHGFPEFIAMARVVRGWAWGRRGDWTAAVDEVATGIALWRDTGFENWQPWFSVLKVEALAALDRRADALDEIGRELARTQLNGENQFRSLLLAEQAMLWARDDPARAAAGFDAALALAAAQGGTAWQQHIAFKRRSVGCEVH